MIKVDLFVLIKIAQLPLSVNLLLFSLTVVVFYSIEAGREGCFGFLVLNLFSFLSIWA